MAFPILAWLPRPKAETRVLRMARRAAESTSPAETRSWSWVWCGSCEPAASSTCCRLCEMRSRPMKRRRTDMAKPARTSARSRPKGCRIELRFHTSKLPRMSTATQRRAPRESKRMRCERAVRAREPSADQSV